MFFFPKPSIQKSNNLIEFQSNSENVLLPIHRQPYTCTFLISNISIHQSIFTSTSSCPSQKQSLISKQVSVLDLCIRLQFASTDSYIKGCAKGNFKLWVAPWKHLQPPSAWWDPLSKARKALAASRLGLSSPINQQKRSQSDHTAWRLSPHKHENEKKKCSHKCKQNVNTVSIYINLIYLRLQIPCFFRVVKKNTCFSKKTYVSHFLQSYIIWRSTYPTHKQEDNSKGQIHTSQLNAHTHHQIQSNPWRSAHFHTIFSSRWAIQPFQRPKMRHTCIDLAF